MYAEAVEINNATPLRKDLLTGISEIHEGGYKRVKVKGKTTEVDPTIEEVEETEVYTLNVIYSDGDLILKNGLYTIGENGAVESLVDNHIISGGGGDFNNSAWANIYHGVSGNSWRRR